MKIFQNIIEKASEFNLLDKSKDNAIINPKAYKLIMKFASLPLLETEMIKDSFDDLVTEVKTKYDWVHPLTGKDEDLKITSHPDWEAFIQYYEFQWLKREGPEKITVSGEEERTNNALESNNKELKAALDKEKTAFFSKNF